MKPKQQLKEKHGSNRLRRCNESVLNNLSVFGSISCVAGFKLLLSFLILIYVFIPSLVLSQSQTDSIHYLKSYFYDTRDIIKEPFKWDKKDLANFTLAAGGTVFLMLHDEKLDRFASVNHSKGLKNVFKYGVSPFGNGVYTLPLLGAVYLGGYIGGNDYDQSIALLGLKTFILTAGEATVIKFAFQRHRPIDNSPPDAFIFDGPLGDLRDDGSFVSRHSASAFAVATVFAHGYCTQKKWVPWVAYSLASLVTISRVYERDHWASDAFAGACLGYVTGRFMFDLNQKYLHKCISRKKN